MRRILKKIVALILFMTIISSSESIYANSYEISVYKYSQERSSWCWVACAKMIGNYYGRYTTQSLICSYVKGSVVNETANLSEVTNAIKYASGRGVSHIGVAEFSVFCVQMQIQRPAVIRMQWYGGGGHVYVVTGVNEQSGVSVNSLRLLDPIEGVSERYYSYSELCNGTILISGSGYYTDTWWSNVPGL